MALLAEISVGELVDKITILELKLAHLRDAAQRANVRRELAALSEAYAREIGRDNEVELLRGELKAVNGELWRVEDDLRALEREKNFGDGFVALARSVYRLNDRRAAIKRRVNDATGSTLIEEKSYAAY
jgi:hypothetical protein